MARIRTIKPEFFTSDDICALSPLARLLYVGLWCEADRAGRLVWMPRAFKRRYLPDDACDIDRLADELLKRGTSRPSRATSTSTRARRHRNCRHRRVTRRHLSVTRREE